jgi:hypothetical protein
MTLTNRIAVFIALWLLAGGFCFGFADISIEAGESKSFARLELVYLAPIIAAYAVAFTVVHGHCDTWQQRDHYEEVIGWLLIAFFVARAVVALTRHSRRQFVGLSVILVFFSRRKRGLRALLLSLRCH